MLQESRTHYGCSVKHLRPSVTLDVVLDTFRCLRRGGRIPSIGARARRHETRHSFTRDITVTDSPRKVVDIGHVSRYVIDASSCSLERASARARARGGPALVPRVERLVGAVRVPSVVAAGATRTDADRVAGRPKRTARSVRVSDVRTVLVSSPEQIRTAVSALRGRRPRPLDDGADGLGGEDSNPQ